MSKNRYNDTFVLSKKQEQLMDILWASETPLTSMEIFSRLQDPNAVYSYIVHMLTLLEKNDMIREVGTVPSGRKRARLFEAALTRNEYAASLALSSGIQSGDIADVAVALIKGSCGHSDMFYQQLNEIIEKLQKKSNEF